MLSRRAHFPLPPLRALRQASLPTSTRKQVSTKPPQLNESATAPRPSLIHPHLARLSDTFKKAEDLPRWGKWALGGVTVVAIAGLGVALQEPDPIVTRSNPADKANLQTLSTYKLLNGWVVYAFCAQPTLVEWSESLFMFFHNLPVVGPIADFFVRKTFFKQFLAGETVDEALRNAWLPLRNRDIGTLCGYNLEAKHDGSVVPPDVLQYHIDETLNVITGIGKFGTARSAAADVRAGDTRCWVRIKLTGLTPDPEVIGRASRAILASRRPDPVHYPGAPQDGDVKSLFSPALGETDLAALRELDTTLRHIMKTGQAYGVRVIVDAEQTWYQPAIDVFTEELMREFNTGQGPPVVCASFQAYLRRNSDLIRSQLQRAQRDGYKLIFKQVRGAYHPYEVARWAAEGRAGPPPVWCTKPETDQSYHAGMRLGLEAVRAKLADDREPDVAAIWATHNEISVDEGVALVRELGLGTPDASGALRLEDGAARRIAFAQLFGVKDNLTNRIAAELRSANGLPVVCKSVSYGEFEEAIPFLSRRAIENKTVMEGRGGAVSERRRLGREILRRFVPFYDYE